MNNIISSRNTFILLLILAGAATRLVPHPFNFTAITAIALFAGARFSNKALAFLIPIGAMLLSDLVIGISWRAILWVYVSFLLVVVLGFIIRNKVSILSVIAASLGSSVLFYLITNFAVWPGNSLYSQDFSGLVHSYLAGIPFFKNQIAGDLFYNAILFGGFYFIENRFPSLKEEKIKA